MATTSQVQTEQPPRRTVCPKAFPAPRREFVSGAASNRSAAELGQLKPAMGRASHAIPSRMLKNASRPTPPPTQKKENLGDTPRPLSKGLRPSVHPVFQPPARERGQALMEMALVLPLIMVFILTLVDFGIAIDRREVLQHAVYEGSRQGIVGSTIDEIKARTMAQSQGLLTAADITVCYIDNDANGDINAGDDVRVSANYLYKFSVGGGEILTAFGVPVPSIALTPKADARLANGPQGAEPTC